MLFGVKGMATIFPFELGSQGHFMPIKILDSGGKCLDM